MAERENIWIPKLKQYLADSKISRREFIRYSALLGMSSGAAYMWAGKITGQPLAPPVRAQDMPKGGTLKISMRVPKLDSPHTYSWVYDSNVSRQVVGYVTRTGVDNVTRPHLCSRWEASDDLKTWTFTVADMKWHSGRPLVAEDFAWNIGRCLDPDTGSSVVGLMKGYMLKEVDTGQKDDDGNAVMTTELWDANAIEVKDDKTMVLNLQEPQVAVPEHLFHYPMQILDPAENGLFQVGSNGVMPFELVELEVSRRAVLKRRPDGAAHLDEVHFIDLGDNPAAEAAALQSKQVHGNYEGNVEQYQLFKDMEHVDIHEVVTANTAVVRMRLDAPEFQDPRVRQALRYATDQAKTVQIATGDLGAEAEHHHVCEVHPDYEKLPFFNRDVEKAKQLLADAGHPDGIELEIACKPDPAWEIASVEAMVEQWKEAGIRTRINVLPSAKFWEVWDKVPFGYTSWAHRPLGFMVLGLAYRTGVPWNETAYSNPKFDEILGKAEGTLDIEARRELIGQLEQIMQEDGPIAQSLWRKLFWPMDKKVKGFQLHPTRYMFCEELGIEA
ncbi:MAG TPA: ABC transporter substrate-binding protein [Aestuariivirgaceae bacterium]|nr:ABC transporter substrate-binding protein [Aestuariivirgaceae bacterium]